MKYLEFTNSEGRMMTYCLLVTEFLFRVMKRFSILVMPSQHCQLVKANKLHSQKQIKQKILKYKYFATKSEMKDNIDSYLLYYATIKKIKNKQMYFYILNI